MLGCHGDTSKKNKLIHCPIPGHNDKTPSFSIFDNGKHFRCFGCGVHGDVISFVEQVRGISFRDAMEFLKDPAGMCH
jgi:DNA primase